SIEPAPVRREFPDLARRVRPLRRPARVADLPFDVPPEIPRCAPDRRGRRLGDLSLAPARRGDRSRRRGRRRRRRERASAPAPRQGGGRAALARTSQSRRDRTSGLMFVAAVAIAVAAASVAHALTRRFGRAVAFAAVSASVAFHALLAFRLGYFDGW